MRTPTALILTASTVSSFAFLPQQTSTSTTALNGLFDGVKEAFSAPALERSQIDAARETPIDRWMGWSVVSDQDAAAEVGSKVAAGTYGVDGITKVNVSRIYSLSHRIAPGSILLQTLLTLWTNPTTLLWSLKSPWVLFLRKTIQNMVGSLYNP